MKKQLFAVVMLAASFGASAQSKYGATPQDSLTCLENNSLYTEYVRQKEYRSAQPYWLKAVDVCPKFSKNLYIKGVTMYKSFIKEEKDANKKTVLVDSLLWIYDTRIDNFGQRGYVLGRKGSDLIRYDKSRFEEAYEILGESFELQGMKSERGALTAYYIAAEKMMKAGKIDKAELVELFPKIAEVLAYNTANPKKPADKEKWVNTTKSIEGIFSKYANCEALLAIYQPKFDATPQDTNLLIQIIAFLSKSDCTDSELFLQASMNLDEVKPSALSKFGIGRSLLKKERYNDAVAYFKQAAEMAELDEMKVNSYRYIALTYLQTKSYANAKAYALKMLSVDNKNGDAYMIIGDAYLYGSKSVGANSCEQAGGYWAAISKYQKAKSLDAQLAEKANKKISSAKAQFPKKEDCFIVGKNTGESFHVGGWINEDVTIQTK